MQLRAISLVLLALAWFACQSYTIRKSLNPDELSGQYYKGDHLGYNVDLILAASGTYSARLYGDVGEYGTWQGHWSIEGNLIALQPPIELKLGKKRFEFLQRTWTRAPMSRGMPSKNWGRNGSWVIGYW